MQPIYVEVGDEITTVIERLKASPAKEVALVVPKGAVLLQSIVNLKLAKKTALDLGKEITLVTTDKIGRNLAAQVGIANLAHLDDDMVDDGGTAEVPAKKLPAEEPEVIGGVRIHRYYDKDDTSEVSEPSMEPIADEKPEPIIVPQEPEKPIVKQEEPEQDDGTPIVVRNVTTEAAIPPVVEIIKPKKSTPPPATPQAAPKKKRNFRKVFLFALYLIILALIGTGAVGAFYLPTTVVSISVPGDAWQHDYPGQAIVGTQSDGSTTFGTAELLTSENTATIAFKATGTQNIGDKAAGTATVSYINSSTPQTVPAGTRLVANGIAFLTNQDITVPGAHVANGIPVAGSATVAVTAESEGDNGNMSNVPATIASPSNLFAQIISTTGGTTKTVTIVSQTDIANAKQQLTKQLQDTDKADLDTKTAGRLTDTSTDTFALSDFHYSVDVGSQNDGGNVTGKGTATRLAVDVSGIQPFVQKLGEKDLKDDQTLDLNEAVVKDLKVDISKQSASFTVSASGEIHQTVPADVIRDQLSGKTVESGTSLITTIVHGATVKIDQKPSWWPIKHFPLINKYLKVQSVHE